MWPSSDDLFGNSLEIKEILAAAVDCNAYGDSGYYDGVFDGWFDTITGVALYLDRCGIRAENLK